MSVGQTLSFAIERMQAVEALAPPQQEVKCRRGRSFFYRLEVGFCGCRPPPIRAARAAVREKRAEQEFSPAVIFDEDQEEVAAGFEDAVRLGQRLFGAFAAHMVQGVGADNGIEAGGFKRQFAHVGGFDGGALGDAGGFQIFQKAILRAPLVSEVAFERIGKEVGGDEGRLRAGGEDHDGGPACAGAEIEDSSYTRAKKVLSEQPGRAVHIERAHHEEGGASPQGDHAECGHRPAGPIAEAARDEGGESGEEND